MAHLLIYVCGCKRGNILIIQPFTKTMTDPWFKSLDF